jgi:hypothetical protein
LVGWPAIHAQFGAGFKAIRQMKPVFLDALIVALAGFVGGIDAVRVRACERS